jgi:hypothetical protein
METAMSVELTWRVALLGAVAAADIAAFIGLVAKEVRDRSVTPAVDEIEATAGKQRSVMMAGRL